MIIAICRVRDEADIIGYTVERMLNKTDHVIVADNGSADGTRDILNDLYKAYDHLTIVDDPEHSHWQGARTTELMHHAGALGAEWILPFDADEAFPVITPANADVVYIRSHVYVPNESDDTTELNPLIRMQHHLKPYEPYPKVCFRYNRAARIKEGNHEVQHPGTRHMYTNGMNHYQYRSLEQVIRKVRQGTKALEATELPVSTGAHWKNLAAFSDEQLASWWDTYINQPTTKTSQLI